MASGGASPAPSIMEPNRDSSSSTPAPVNGLSKLNPDHILHSTTTLASSSGNIPPADPTSPPPTKICVFCGSSPGNSPKHMEAARSLARVFHAHNIHLVYGGGTVGLMGEIARTLVSLSGPQSVHGIIPSPLMSYEQGPSSTSATAGPPAFTEYGHTTIVRDMHTRKQLMAREVLSGGPGSGFVALSGGYGTLEELMEVVTWNQLGIHNRGVVVYNVDGYWDGLLGWVKGATDAGFVGEGPSKIIREAREAEEVVALMREYTNTEGRFKLAWGNE